MPFSGFLTLSTKGKLVFFLYLMSWRWRSPPTGRLTWKISILVLLLYIPPANSSRMEPSAISGKIWLLRAGRQIDMVASQSHWSRLDESNSAEYLELSEGGFMLCLRFVQHKQDVAALLHLCHQILSFRPHRCSEATDSVVPLQI